MAKLMEDVSAHESNSEERKNIYADYYKTENTELELQNFKTDLLKHLAGSIVIKEHRTRYQKEQFDRFLASQRWMPLKSNNQSLGDFCNNYAKLIHALTEKSHFYKSPKIAANYDDYDKETVLPINPAIFYYFFSANRSGKTWAQWMLAAARYPNDKTRRAYMRFFC